MISCAVSITVMLMTTSGTAMFIIGYKKGREDLRWKGLAVQVAAAIIGVVNMAGCLIRLALHA